MSVGNMEEPIRSPSSNINCNTDINVNINSNLSTNNNTISNSSQPSSRRHSSVLEHVPIAFDMPTSSTVATTSTISQATTRGADSLPIIAPPSAWELSGRRQQANRPKRHSTVRCLSDNCADN